MFLQSKLLSRVNSKLVCGISDNTYDFLSRGQFTDETLWVQARSQKILQFMNDLDLAQYACIVPRLEHGTRIVHLTDVPQDIPIADGLSTGEHGVFLGVTVADCAGIVLYGTSNIPGNTGSVLAVLHSGWRGTVGITKEHDLRVHKNNGLRKSIVEHALDMFATYHVPPSELYGWISPCARKCCYEIGEELVPLFETYPQSLHTSMVAGNIVHRADLSLYIVQQLCSYGVRESHIEVAPYCSICSQKFHSHRAMQLHNTLGSNERDSTMQSTDEKKRNHAIAGRSLVFAGIRL